MIFLNTLCLRKDVANKSNLKNVILIREKVQNMRKFYEKCHVAIAHFHKSGGKSCPTFIIEALASGRPLILGHGVGIRKLIQDLNVGLSFNDCDLINKIQIMRDDWENFASRSRDLLMNTPKHIDRY